MCWVFFPPPTGLPYALDIPQETKEPFSSQQRKKNKSPKNARFAAIRRRPAGFFQSVPWSWEQVINKPGSVLASLRAQGLGKGGIHEYVEEHSFYLVCEMLRRDLCLWKLFFSAALAYFRWVRYGRARGTEKESRLCENLYQTFAKTW